MRCRPKAVADLGWPALVDHLIARTRTPRGAARARALAPLQDVASIVTRQAEISEARALQDVGEGLPLDGVREIDAALERSERAGALAPDQLREIASTLETSSRLRRHLAARAARAPRLTGRALLIADLADLRGALHEAFDASGHLVDGASPALGPLRRRAAAARDELDHVMSRMLDDPAIAPHLQDRFCTQRDARYVLPVRADARARVRGIVHGTSQSGQTFFVEPEAVVDLNNRLKLAELEVEQEEQRILAELTRMVAEELPAIRLNLDLLTELDVLDAAARLSADLRGAPPAIGPGAGVDLRRARHPLMVLAGRTCVPNDIRFGQGQTLVITGPNAGGKTVALKLTGLLTMMGLAGLHIPAQEGSSVPLIEDLVTDIGDEQSLENELSTFSAHIINLRELVAAASPSTMFLLDEIAAGTAPEQGAALAQAVLEALADRGATGIVTSHHDRLKLLPTGDGRFVNASVGFDLEAIRPTFELRLGVPGASGALSVARRMGLGEEILRRAAELLDASHSRLDDLLAQLERERAGLAEALAAAAREREAAAATTEEARGELARAREIRARAIEVARDEAVAELTRARVELREVRGVLRRNPRAPVAELSRQVDDAARAIRETAPGGDAAPGRPAERADLDRGASVWVRSLGRVAQVASEPRGDRIAVQAGALRLTVSIDELRIPDGPGAESRSARALRGHNAFDLESPATRDRRGGWPALDVRGERADVALGMAEKFLDDALRAEDEQVLIIHGHGTGRLRDHLRAELRRFPGVTQVRPASPEEGGDGVTIVRLR